MIVETVVFVVAIAILSALRGRTLFELQGTSLLLLGSTRPGLWLYSLIMLPGTVLHELSHWIVAELVQVRTGKIQILPDEQLDKDGRLGSVETAKAGPFRSFLIGVAPFVVGLLTLSLLGYFLQTGWGVYPWGYNALMVYGLIVVGSSMILSPSDRRYLPIVLGLFLVIALALYYSGVSPSTSTVKFVASLLARINLVLLLTISLNLVMIGLLYIARRTLERVTHKKVSR